MAKTVELTKSIDALIDDLFAKSEDLNPGKAPTTADASIAQAPESETDEARGAGRPKQISEVPQNDEDGKRDGDYDSDITEKESEEGEEPEEAKKQAKVGGQDKGEQKENEKPAQAPFGKSLSEAEYAEFQALKQEKAQRAQAENLRKARQEQETLIKSAVKEATSQISKENAALRKSLDETRELVKAMAERPQRRKSVDNISALEKSQSGGPKVEHFSKSEMLDAAEELVMKKSMDFRDTDLVELDATGFVYNPVARAALEKFMASKSK